MSRLFRIAIDGPAASGKSTTAKLVARRLNFGYIDSGAMYRAVTLKCLESEIDPTQKANDSKVAKVASDASIRFPRLGSVELDGRDVSNLIRSSNIVRAIGPVAANPSVREILAQQQRNLASDAAYAGLPLESQPKGVVMDGRDIGTVILPDAELKVFIVADARVRAQRRFDELMAKQGTVPGETVDDIARDLAARDLADQTRTISPLKKPDDAVVLDTSNCTIEDQVNAIENMVHSRLGSK
ncbi:cytidylate kinase [Phycomyces nitens]|nr:cytidylate kinase [Phycomyces nitens]